MTVAGDNTVTNYVKRLNCPVPLKGGLIGDNQESMIYIKRTMEENGITLVQMNCLCGLVT